MFEKKLFLIHSSFVNKQKKIMQIKLHQISVVGDIFWTSTKNLTVNSF